jgi:hypothetical protein
MHKVETQNIRQHITSMRKLVLNVFRNASLASTATPLHFGNSLLHIRNKHLYLPPVFFRPLACTTASMKHTFSSMCRYEEIIESREETGLGAVYIHM